MRLSRPEVLVLLAAGSLAATASCKGGDRQRGAPATSQSETASVPAESAGVAPPAESTAPPPSQPAAKPAAKPAPVTPVPDPKLAAGVGLAVYPSKGQSQPQRVQDEQACYDWAREQTGIDPSTVAVNADSAGEAAKQQADSATSGAAVRGAARGAVGGAAVGAIAGDAGKGAAIGAVVGGARGRKAKKETAAQAEQQGQQQAVAQGEATMQKFSSAMATCLQGRGYAVN